MVEDVVATLTSAAGAGYGGAAALRAGMRRASDQFDETAAAALAGSLVETLCRTPDDVRVLETLVILGSRTPAPCRSTASRSGTRAGGSRTCSSGVGQYERAYCVGELIAEHAHPEGGPSKQEAETVAQLVRDAEFAAARGRTRAAVRCLQEAQRIDPEPPGHRGRDPRPPPQARVPPRERVPRGQGSPSSSWSSRGSRPRSRCGSTGLEELEVAADRDRRRPRRHARAPGGDRRAPRAGEVLGDDAVALLQQDVLRHDIELLERPVPPIVLDLPGDPLGTQAGPDPYSDADAARERGLAHAEKGRVIDALEELEHALAIAPVDWPYRARVEANVSALQAWKAKNPGKTTR
jgi:tetratricopeptide (TPR) repeat protein